jgi:hypothetical protein
VSGIFFESEDGDDIFLCHDGSLSSGCAELYKNASISEYCIISDTISCSRKQFSFITPLRPVFLVKEYRKRKPGL